ncbi:MAG: propanediol utilization protein [Elusimicrobia bacterium]|nr:MAG: propanediol utilization protein [Elusimicrobiota bacterium]
MQTGYSIGLLETSSLAKGVEASDAMVKEASVDLVAGKVIARGKYTILIRGPVGEVESSMRAGTRIADKTVVHKFIIRNVHEQTMNTLEKRNGVEKLEAFGMIETKDAVAAIQASDSAAKAAKVHIIETKAVLPGGKGYVSMTGEVAAVRTAVAAGIQVVPSGQLVSHIVIPLADPQLLATVGK